MKNPINEYFDYVESVAGDEGTFFKIEDGDSPVVIASYKDVPEAGSTTSFSYGLSSAFHSEWKFSRPELVIAVDSLDDSWGIAMGEMIKNGRHNHLFSYGSILNFGQPISDESPMSAFFVFACSILENEDLEVKLSDRLVHISQIYPIHKEEIELVKTLGAERFFSELDINFFDVHRLPARLS